MRKVVHVVSAEGDAIEVFRTDDPQLAEGARLGAQAMLDLFKDEMDLEEGYRITLGEENGVQNSSEGYNIDISRH